MTSFEEGAIGLLMRGVSVSRTARCLSAASLVCIYMIVTISGPATCVAQEIQDPSRLIGKKVVAQRMPLCDPGTFTSVLAYAGKSGVVVSVKPSKTYNLSPAMLARMAPETRAMMEDQQKAATVLVQFEDGKKLDTCAAIGPRRLAEYFELAEGETAAAATPAVPAPQPSAPPAPAASTTANTRTATVAKTSADAPAVDMLSDAEVQSALAGGGKDHYVQINDAGLMAAQGALGTLPHITLFMPEAMIAIRKEQARKQYLSYDPSDDDRRRMLTVFAQGYVGKTYQEGCVSVTRVVLLSSPSGEVVEEAYSSEMGSEAWANAFGATNHCGWLRAKFSLAAVKKAKAAAKDGEFFIAVFAGSHNTKTYKVKHKHQEKLALD